MAGPSRKVASAAPAPIAPSPSVGDPTIVNPSCGQSAGDEPECEVILILDGPDDAVRPSPKVAPIASGSSAPAKSIANRVQVRAPKRRKIGDGKHVDGAPASHGSVEVQTFMETRERGSGADVEVEGPRLPSRSYSARPSTERTVDIECWPLQCLVRGDGTKSRTGRELEPGKFYGSAYTHSSIDSFHEIDVTSLVVSSRGQKVVEWSYRALKKNRKLPADIEKPVALLEGVGDASSHLRRVVVDWCKKFTGVVMIIGGPTSRGPIAGIESQFDRRCGTVFQRGRAGRCVFDCIVNAVDRVLGREAAQTTAAEVSEMVMHFPSLNAVRDVFQQLSAPVRALRVEVDSEDGFRWLAEDAKGVLLVRLGQCGVVDYCVVVDTYQALIYDSAEEYPIRLMAETLRKCGGDVAQNLRVLQVRQIIKHEQVH